MKENLSLETKIELVKAGTFTGIVEGLPDDVYHSSPGVSSTGLKRFLKYPAKYLHPDNEDTPSRKKGRLTHMRTLEPLRFAETVVKIDGPMNKNPYKAQAEAAKDAGMTPVNAEDFAEIEGMAASVMKHTRASQLIRNGKQEVSFFAIDPQTGVLIKCRADTWVEKARMIGDLKYFDDVMNEFRVKRHMLKMQYDIQTALYLKVVSLVTQQKYTYFGHIFVEEKAPHACRVYALRDPEIERAMMTVDAGLAGIAECQRTGVFPMPDDDIVPIEFGDSYFAYEGDGV